MTSPLTAGERLSQSSSPEPPSRGGGTAGRPPPGRRPKSRRQSFAARWAGRIGQVFLALVVVGGLAGAVTVYAVYSHYAADLPDVKGLQAYQPRVMSRVYAGDLRLLEEMATERRIFVPYAAIPDLVKRAFLAAEDQNFFSHGGVDPLAILRAAATDLLHYGQGRRPVGASTITQQVAKNMLLDNQISLSRKIREALLAMRIERTLSKDRILELYLNEIYLGEGAYGVAAAAQTYFDKPLDALTPAEAAFLAALPKGPNNYNPQKYPNAARDRRNWVLDRMVDTHAITVAQAQQAKAEPVAPAVNRRPEMVTGADFFAAEVRRRLIDRFGPDQAMQGGLVVRTSLDPTLQHAADAALRAELMRYDQAHDGWRGPVAHVPADGALSQTWQTALAAIAPPPGMLPSWRLGVVIGVTPSEARVGMVDQTGARVLPMLLSDLAWARTAHGDPPAVTLGPTPHRIGDVLQVGDVVMTEPAPAAPADGKAAPRPERLLLRQIPKVEGALVSLDPTTGRVLAMCGGWSYDQSQFNRATQAQRQPGSSFKPLVYLTAMEQGISPSQHFMDAPFVLNTPDGGQWRPGNYEQDFNGSVPLHVALEKSLNLVTVRVAARVGMDAVAANAIAFHEVDAMPHVLPAALGAVDTTVLRHAGVYAALDEDGREVRPTLIDSVQDRDGHVIYAAPAVACQGCDDPAQPPSLLDTRKQIADPASAFQVVMMMEGVVQRGTGVPAGQGLGRQIAGKTGTTQDFQDAWFGGFTPDLVTMVWIGFDNPASLGNNETGAQLAAPVFHDFMQAALKDRPNLKFVPPPGLTIASYDSGFGTVTDAFKPGQVPGASSPLGGTASADAQAGEGSGGGDGGAASGGTAAGVDSGLGGLY